MDPFSFNIESDPSTDSDTYTDSLALLPTLVTMARSDKPEDVLQGVTLLRKLLAEGSNAPLEEVVETGVAKLFVKCMTNENTDLQFEASQALTNIAAESVGYTHYIINLGVVPLWIGHLSSGNDKCQEQAAWALGTIAGKGAKVRDHILELGAMQPLLDLICSCGDNKPSLLRSAVCALSNLFRAEPPLAIEYAIPAVPVFTQMLQHPDPEVSLASIWALSHITDGPSDCVQLVIDSGVVPSVVQMLSTEHTKHNLPAVRIIGNISAANVELCQVAINAGCLPPMKSLLEPWMPREVRKEAAWTLSNVAANEDQVQAIIDAGLLPVLVSTLGAYECEVQKEAVWACANIGASGSSEQISHLVECGVLEALCEVLRRTTDDKIIAVSLEAIHGFLNSGAELVGQRQCTGNPYVEKVQNCGGSLSVEKFMTHWNPDIQRLTQEIISAYFQSEAKEITQPVVDDEQPPLMQRPKEASVEGEDDNGKGF